MIYRSAAKPRMAQPNCNPSDTAPEDQDWPRTIAHAPKRVLVVEDNLDTARSLALILRMMGHEAEYSVNGSTALAEVTRFKPHVVIVDIGLPGINGHEVCEEIKRREATKDIRVLMLTAHNAPEDRRRSHRAGSEVHLVKPIDPMVLEELLK